MTKFVIQYSGATVYHMFYQRLYELEKESQLKLAPKLTFLHIWPTVWQKMKVSLATQLFSTDVATALKILREDKKTAYKFNGTWIN